MTSEGRGARAREPFLYFGFFLTGIITVLLGPLIPELEVRWGITHSQVAWLFPAQFFGAAIGSVLSPFKQKYSLLLGYTVVAGGLSVLAIVGWPQALVAMGLVGLGLGLVLPATNLVVARAHPERRGAALTSLNLLWGLGAVSCPLLVATLLHYGSARVLLSVLVVSCAGVALGLAWILRIVREPVPQGAGARPGGELRPLFVLAAMLFLYIGVETAVNGWLVTFADQVGEKGVISLWIGSGFWAALLVGRVVSAWLLRHVAEKRLYQAALALAGLGVFILLVSTSRTGIAAGALVTGFALAPLFPLTVSLLAEATVVSGSQHTGWVFAVGSCGGAVLPWLSGQLIAGSATPLSGFAVPFLGLVALAVLFALLHRA